MNFILLVLLFCCAQLVQLATAQMDEEEYKLDVLLGDSRRRMEFFNELCKFTNDLNNQKTEMKCELEKKELQSQADGLRQAMEQMNQDQSNEMSNVTELQKVEQMICAEKQHSLRATTDVALKSLNISLQFFTHREQELMMEVAKSRELAEIIQVKLTRIQQTLLDGAYEASTYAEKVRLENELIGVKSRIIHLDSQLADLKIEENFTSSHAHQMLEQEKQLETSISPQQIYPENFPTYLVTQLERSHETLKMERKKFQTQLLTMSTLMDSKQNHMEFLTNLTISNFNIQIDKANKKIEETSEQVRNLEMQLKAAKQQEYDLKSRLNESKSQVSIKESNLVSCNKLHQDCENKVNKWPPPGSVYLRTGIYFFNPILLNWTSAREHCQSLGMDLVAVETEEENTLLVERAKTFFSGWYIWTSGCYSNTEEAVVWYSTGYKVTYSNWKSSEGNSRNVTKCVKVHPVDNMWKETSISIFGPSICEKA